jgi:TatD DNase family protein
LKPQETVDQDTVVYTDSHAHLSYLLEKAGQAAFDAVLAAYRPTQARILDPGVEFDDFIGRLALLGGHPNIRLAAGIWPDVPALPSIERALAVLEEQVRHPQCLAVGEAGLDYHWMNGTAAEQMTLFSGQCELAVQYNKPLLVHSRQAAADTLQVVRRYSTRIPVLIHCFGYDPATATDFLDSGCYISFAGNVTYKNQTDLQAAARLVPADKMLLETDTPYMNPLPRRGKNSSPLDIERTYQFVAELRSCPVPVLAEQLADNAARLFGEQWQA